VVLRVNTSDLPFLEGFCSVLAGINRYLILLSRA
jgi:hypothetical protein